MARIAAVVFDIDGTLIDHSGSVTAALEDWLPELGVRSAAELVDAWLAIEEVHVREWRSGRIGWQEQRRRRLRDFLPLVGRPAGTPVELDAVFEGYLRRYEASWRAFPDAAPAVAALAALGFRLAVLSNGARVQQRAKLAAVGLLDRFDPILTTEELGVAKPDPAAYRAVSERLGSTPHELLHVGDLLDLDVEAPRASGFAAVQIDRSLQSAPPDRISSLTELPALIDALDRGRRP